MVKEELVKYIKQNMHMPMFQLRESLVKRGHLKAEVDAAIYEVLRLEKNSKKGFSPLWIIIPAILILAVVIIFFAVRNNFLAPFQGERDKSRSVVRHSFIVV